MRCPAALLLAALISACGEGGRDESPAATGAAPVRNKAIAVDAGGSMTCSLHADRKVRCWGPRSPGGSERPAVVADVEGAVEIAVGSRRACARLTDGSVRCWGVALAESGYAGDRAHQACGVTGAQQIAAGWDHSCAIVAGGAVRCWADKDRPYEPCDRGEVTRAVEDLAGAEAIALGAGLGCALVAGGRLSCWSSALGAKPIPRIEGARRVSVFHDFCVVTADRSVACGRDGWRPKRGITGAEDVSVGLDHTCARLAGGTVACWGENERGQLGDGTRASRLPDAERLAPLRGVVDVEAGDSRTCAVTGDGAVHCWGSPDGDPAGPVGADVLAPQRVDVPP